MAISSSKSSSDELRADRIAYLARRCISPRPVFRIEPSPDRTSSKKALAELREGERFIGAYENAHDDPTKDVILTTLGIRLSDGDRQDLIEYTAILSVDLPDEWWRDKAGVDAVVLGLKDNRTVGVPITGGDDAGGRDIYSFHRFFVRVIDFLDRQSRNSAARH